VGGAAAGEAAEDAPAVGPALLDIAHSRDPKQVVPLALALRPFRLPASADVRPPDAKPTDTGGSTIYQTAGDAQITAQIGLPAQQANRAQYPSSGGPIADDGGSTLYQTTGHAQITAKPGPAALDAAQQSAFFPVSDLPRT